MKNDGKSQAHSLMKIVFAMSGIVEISGTISIIWCQKTFGRTLEWIGNPKIAFGTKLRFWPESFVND
jgi:hypothetical protein